MQGGLTWLWRDAPYVIAAKKLFNMAVAANKKGDVFPVRCLLTDNLCAMLAFISGTIIQYL